MSLNRTLGWSFTVVLAALTTMSGFSACSTSDADNGGTAGTDTGGAGGDDAVGGGGGASGSTSTAGTAGTSIDCSAPVAAPADGMILNFDNLCGTEACSASEAYPFLAGTWAPYPGAVADADATGFCTTYDTQGVMTGTMTDGVWQVSGTLATWSGMGLWLGSCVDASAFSGITVTLAGNAGPTGQIYVGVNTTTGEDVAPSYEAPLAVTDTATPVTAAWTDFAPGETASGVTFDPSKITSIYFHFDWPCLEGTVSEVSVTLDDLKFAP